MLKYETVVEGAPTTRIGRVAVIVTLLREIQRELHLIKDEYSRADKAFDALSAAKIAINRVTDGLYAAFTPPTVVLQTRVTADARLHDLTSLVDGNVYGEDPPIDADTVARIVTRLRALPRSDVRAFLDQFKVQLVSDLRKSDMGAVRHVLGSVEARIRRTR